MPQTLAASALQTYLECPQRYRLQYLEQLPRRRSGSRVLAQGLQAALTEYYLRIMQSSDCRPDLSALFDQVFDGRACSDSWEEERLRRRGREALVRYQQLRASQPQHLLAVDLQRALQLGPVRVSARLDRLEQRANASLTAVLHRTGSRPADATAAEHNVAAAVIQAGLSTDFPDARVKVEQHHIQQGIVWDVTKSPDELDVWLAELGQVAARLAADEEFPPGDSSLCCSCPVRRHCKVRPKGGGN